MDSMFGMWIQMVCIIVGFWLLVAIGALWALHYFTGTWGVCLTVFGHGGCL